MQWIERKPWNFTVPKKTEFVWRRALVNVSVRCGHIIWAEFVGSSSLFLSGVLLLLRHFFVYVIILFPRLRLIFCFS